VPNNNNRSSLADKTFVINKHSKPTYYEVIYKKERTPSLLSPYDEDHQNQLYIQSHITAVDFRVRY
jgi:hypothetical protein